MLSTTRSLYVRSSTNLGSAGTRRGGAPTCELSEQLDLLLRAPCPGAQDILQSLLAVDAKSVRDGAHTIGTEGAPGVSGAPCMQADALGVDVRDLARCPALILGQLRGHTHGVAKLRLKAAVSGGNALHTPCPCGTRHTPR